MSLLMKALEQAAKDRDEARSGPTAPAAAPEAGEPKPELSLALELLAPDGSAPQAQADTAHRSRSTSGTGTAAGREQNRAATVMQAGERARARLDDQRRINPLIVFGTLAGLFAAGFATYVYLQIYHPGVFARQRQPPPSAPPSQGTVPAPPAATPAAAPDSGIPSSAVLQSRAADALPAAVAPAPAPAPKPAAPAPPEKTAEVPAGKIVVSGGGAVAVNPALAEAYGALQAGNLDGAQRLYAQLAGSEPRNVDALLGLAAVAALQGRSDDATRNYQRILELDPRHALAQSGLIGLYGRGDPIGAETRLKQLLAREPSAFLYFTLGNLYADQSLWAQAQQAYFQAHHLESGNPDYAYNLAVSLEHMSQPKLALGFYRQAAALAAKRGHANFNAAQVKDRISRLAAQVE